MINTLKIYNESEHKQMSMEKVISYLGTNRGNGEKKNLDRLRELLSLLGNPHKDLPYIHITGTNGKGSTASMFQSVLREANLKVGLFTSPHLEFINERFRINETFIEDAELIQIVNKIEPFVQEIEAEYGKKFYAFELLTTVAFIYFQEHAIDLAILEAGIGGRLDSTNVIEQSVLSVITSIGMDHMGMLGNSKEAIMGEKVQILKEAGQLVVGPVDPSLKIVARDWAENVQGDVTFIEASAIHLQETTNDFQVFSYQSYQDVKISFLGRHQIENACLVIEGSEILANQGYPLSKEVIYRGLEKAHWPGRFEKVFDQPLFYMDGAHNEASVERLVESLQELFPQEKFHFVVGMMKDKEIEKMLEQVYPLAKSFLLISPDPNRGFDTKEVAALIETKGIDVKVAANMDEVFAYIEQEVQKDEIVIQFGSLYLVGALKGAQAQLNH